MCSCFLVPWYWFGCALNQVLALVSPGLMSGRPWLVLRVAHGFISWGKTWAPQWGDGQPLTGWKARWEGLLVKGPRQLGLFVNLGHPPDAAAAGLWGQRPEVEAPCSGVPGGGQGGSTRATPLFALSALSDHALGHAWLGKELHVGANTPLHGAYTSAPLGRHYSMPRPTRPFMGQHRWRCVRHWLGTACACTVLPWLPPLSCVFSMG